MNKNSINKKSKASGKSNGCCGGKCGARRGGKKPVAQANVGNVNKIVPTFWQRILAFFKLQG